MKLLLKSWLFGICVAGFLVGTWAAVDWLVGFDHPYFDCFCAAMGGASIGWLFLVEPQPQLSDHQS
jgi:hypothetical protein